MVAQPEAGPAALEARLADEEGELVPLRQRELASRPLERLFGLAQFLFAPIAPLQIADQIASALILAAAIFSHLTVLGAGGIRNRAFAAAAVGGACTSSLGR